MKQLVIVTEDRPGIVADISTALAEKNINIESIDAEATRCHGVIILSVDKYDEALKTLTDASFTVYTENTIVVEVADEPGALAKIARRFQDADLTMRSIRIMKREAGNSLVAIAADHTKEAIKLVEDCIVA